MVKSEEILHIFPDYMRPTWKQAAEMADELQEIRLRAGEKIILLTNGEERYLNIDGQVVSDIAEGICVTERDMEAVLNHICDYSLYAFADEIRQGFLTLPGGHRVGLAGQVVLENEKEIRNMKHICYMNIRISHEVKGAADGVMHYVYEGDQLLNTLIISPPGCGKTTLLRDMIRQISDGTRYGKGLSVSVVDERSEIAGCYLGMPQNDVGMRTDVLDACPKALGMMMLLRSMSPQVVAVDELGKEEDMSAAAQIMHCGSRILATVHGDSLEDIMKKDMMKTQLFDRYITLERREGKCLVKNVYDRNFRICCG